MRREDTLKAAEDAGDGDAKIAELRKKIAWTKSKIVHTSRGASYNQTRAGARSRERPEKSLIIPIRK